MIKISDLSYKYKFSDNILENINLEISDGEIITIVGKNGTGKSTLAKLISGILVPKKGEILIDNINTKNKKTKKELRKQIGILFQNPENQIIFPTIKYDLEFALKNLEIDKRENKIKEALNMVDMNGFYEKESYGLSLGQKQRINIAGILAIGTKYIVMDEPTTMIDTLGKEKIHKIIRELKKKGYTFIIITNNSEELLLGDRIIILEEKKIKKIINKKDIINNIQVFNECEIKLPYIIDILLELKNMRININNIEDYSKENLIKIIKENIDKK